MPEQVWAVRYADRETQIRDLPVGVIAEIAKKNDQSWVIVQAAPLLDLFIANDVFEAMCNKWGVDIPEDMTARELTGYFVQVDDDLPEVFEDGIPQ